jgi:hypothetical protein
MKIKFVPIITAILCAQGFTALRCTAQSVPNLINYQGRLTDQTGAALPQGLYQIQFRLWDSPTASVTNDLIWGQQQTLTVQSGGVFATILGSGGTQILGANPAVNDLSFAFTQSNRYIGVTVVSSNGVSISGASEILPRHKSSRLRSQFDRLQHKQRILPSKGCPQELRCPFAAQAFRWVFFCVTAARSVEPIMRHCFLLSAPATVPEMGQRHSTFQISVSEVCSVPELAELMLLDDR